MTDLIALDSSVAIPLLVRTHTAHDAVVAWWRHRPIVLSGHALPETYSVLTRLPGDARLAPRDAADLLSARFDRPLMLAEDRAAALPRILAELGIAGGAVYDALVGLAALDAGLPLATRDARARSTYDAVGVTVVTPT